MVRLPGFKLGTRTQPETPHSIVRGLFAEIETIYGAYQDLLLNRLGTRTPLPNRTRIAGLGAQPLQCFPDGAYVEARRKIASIQRH